MTPQNQNIGCSEIKSSKLQQIQAGGDAVSFNNSHDNYVVIKNVFLNLFKPSDSNQVDWDWANLLLKKKQLPEIRKRLTDTLGKERVMTDVSIIEHPSLVSRLQVNLQLQVKGKDNSLVDQNKILIETFGRDDIEGKLLILGAPGSGKTTALLSLAEQLIIGAIDHPKTIIPVVLELSTWREDNQSIENWIIEQLYNLHGGNRKRKIYELWLERQVLLPLLDGLDELGLERQKKCTEKLNEFSKTYPQLVVCCRFKQFKTANIKLNNLNGAVCLQALSDKQIEDYFQSINRTELWEEIQEKPALKELLETTTNDEPGLLRIPLFIKLLTDIYNYKETINTKANLLERYIERQLSIDQRQYDHKKNLQNYRWAYKTVEKEPELKYAQNILAWIAKQLQSNYLIDFSIEEIQPSSIEKEFMRGYEYILRYLSFSIFMVAFILNEFLLEGSFESSKYSFIVVFLQFFLWLAFACLYEKRWNYSKIYTQEVIFIFFSKITRKKFWKVYITECKWAFLFWIKPPFTKMKIFFIFVIISMTIITSLNHDNRAYGLVYSLSFISFLCIYKLFDVLRDFETVDDIKARNYPNQGIWLSLASFIIIFIIINLLSVLFRLINVPIGGNNFFLLIWAFWFLDCGGLTCVKHFSLRFVLYQNGVIPWDLARFLNYCVERRLLLRIGGRYRFLHREILDHYSPSIE
jgi:hypothetical protein